jgi:RNA polymerase sigma-70 factor (ECF subfamily)
MTTPLLSSASAIVDPSFDHTRASLLARLSRAEDDAAWREFFDTYWPLLKSVARRSGLNEVDAKDVAQDVLAMLARQMPTFRYDPARGTFKSWLLTLIRRRIARHWRRGRQERHHREIGPETATGETAFLERLPNRQENPLDILWEMEWERNILETALRRVRARVSARQFQIYTLAALQEVPLRTICSALGVHSGQVYLARHRVGRLVKAEVRRVRDATGGSPEV